MFVCTLWWLYVDVQCFFLTVEVFLLSPVGIVGLVCPKFSLLMFGLDYIGEKTVVAGVLSCEADSIQSVFNYSHLRYARFVCITSKLVHHSSSITNDKRRRFRLIAIAFNFLTAVNDDLFICEVFMNLFHNVKPNKKTRLSYCIPPLFLHPVKYFMSKSSTSS